MEKTLTDCARECEMSFEIARPWSVQRRNGDDAAIAQAMEYGRRGTGGVGPLSSELESEDPRLRPDGGTLRRLSLGYTP
jgi:hypothetical protein